MSNVGTEAEYEAAISAVGGSMQREPLPFEQAPPRIVTVPYRSIGTSRGAQVEYDFGDPNVAKYIRDSDLVGLDTVRFATRQGQLQSVRKFEYKGDLLVDAKNNIARRQYNVNSEPLGLLRSLGTNAVRLQYLDTLYQKGFYRSGKPSANGLSGSDQAAMGNLLEYSNAMGRTWDVAFLEVTSLENERSLGGAAAVRVTAKEDVREYVNRDSLDLLGRVLTRAEFREALQIIQARERAPRAGEQQATLGSLSAEAVRQIAPQEVQVNDVADGIDIFRDMLRTARG